MGRLQARQAAALLPGGGFVLYVMGPGLSSAVQDRLDGFRQELREPSFTHSVIHGDWDEGLAQAAVLKWLKMVLISNQRVDLIVCQNDAMAKGARTALETAGREMGRPELQHVRTTGIDGSVDLGQKLVSEGVIAATIIQSSSGRPAIEWAARCIAGKRPEGNVSLPVTPFPMLPSSRRPV
jgi:ABC-type sugar transport system substrate-binding protein